MTCIVCDGRGKVNCPECHGEGFLTCVAGCHEQDCDAVGCWSGDKDCPECEGSGVIGDAA